ncbi:MAG: 1-(5-phosphoribosyl)-5-[(5-phosphoribosylamino)methylideneamino]imidazole-4-carboxamide isomerase [Luteibaculaceae bacterium]
MRIIPAIDMINGKVVRLTQGDYAQKTVYYENPVDLAKSFEQQGVKYLHLVDLDGAKAGKPVNHKILEQIARTTNLAVDVGGGIGSTENAQLMFDYGAAQITAGSIAVKNKPLVFSWLNQFGAERIIIGADVKDGYIATHGWQQISTEKIDDFMGEYIAQGAQYFICTDISKDGMLQGPSTELYVNLLNQFKVNLIASGGVSHKNDLATLLQAGCEGVIIGKAIYEGKIDLKSIL